MTFDMFSSENPCVHFWKQGDNQVKVRVGRKSFRAQCCTDLSKRANHEETICEDMTTRGLCNKNGGSLELRPGYRLLTNAAVSEDTLQSGGQAASACEGLGQMHTLLLCACCIQDNVTPELTKWAISAKCGSENVCSRG